MVHDPHPKFDPKIHHRKSIRLHGYDYCVGGTKPPTRYAAGTKPAAQQAGAYFVTIVTYQRDCLFGKIENEIMVLNGFGKIAGECWHEIPEHFPFVELGAHIIMPNHAHGIIVIHGDHRTATKTSPFVGARHASPYMTHPYPNNHTA